jgi:hypothetical protein
MPIVVVYTWRIRQFELHFISGAMVRIAAASAMALTRSLWPHNL